jgi:hypothetical protein
MPKPTNPASLNQSGKPLKIYPTSHEILKKIKLLTGERMADTVDRLLQKEWKKHAGKQIN